MEPFTKPAIVVGPATMDRYLSAILALSRRAPVVRSVDVAAYVGCSKACVSVAVKQMIRDALIVRDGRGPLVLSEAGKDRAASYLERFEFFYSLLTDAGVDVGSAKDEADAIAAAFSAHSFEILKRKQEKKHDRSDSPHESVEKLKGVSPYEKAVSSSSDPVPRSDALAGGRRRGGRRHLRLCQ